MICGDMKWITTHGHGYQEVMKQIAEVFMVRLANQVLTMFLVDVAMQLDGLIVPQMNCGCLVVMVITVAVRVIHQVRVDNHLKYFTFN